MSATPRYVVKPDPHRVPGFIVWDRERAAVSGRFRKRNTAESSARISNGSTRKRRAR